MCRSRTFPKGVRRKLRSRSRSRLPWHINANPASEDFLVPTEVAFELPAGVTLRGVVYPAGVDKKLSFAEAPLRLYEGVVYVGAVIDIASDVPMGTSTIKATVTYQACDNEKCLLPQTLDVPVALAISSPRDPVDLANPEVFDHIDFSPVIGKVANGSTSSTGGGEGNVLKDAIAKRGWLFAFVLVFLGGLALNLTPCVYPMIPITVSYFGGQAKGRGGRTVLLATLYLLGMAAMYSTLGLIAALTGSLFGSALQNPLVLGVIALVMVGLGTLDVRPVRNPRADAPRGCGGHGQARDAGLVPDGPHGRHRGRTVHRPVRAGTPDLRRRDRESADRLLALLRAGAGAGASLRGARRGVGQHHAPTQVG